MKTWHTGMAFDREELPEKPAMALVANPGSTMLEPTDSARISKASLHRIHSTKEKMQATIAERKRGVFAEIRRTIRQPHEDYTEALRELVAIHCRDGTFVLFTGRDDFYEMLRDGNGMPITTIRKHFFARGRNGAS